MPPKSGLGLVQRQGISLTEGMRQSLALLRMPTQAAAEAIAREAEENPFLVIEAGTGGGRAVITSHDLREYSGYPVGDYFLTVPRLIATG